MNEKPLYTRWSVRDYCLPIVEIWSRAETTDPRQWTSNPQPKHPYIVFVQKKGLIYDYTDQAGIDWIRDELLRLVAADSNYPRWLVGEYYKRTDRIKPLWEKGEALGRDKLVEYLKILRDAWALFDGVWWLMEFAPAGSKAANLSSEARKATERMVPASDTLIRKSLRSIYPKLGERVDQLTGGEIEAGPLPETHELDSRARLYSYANATLFTGEDETGMEKRFDIRIALQQHSSDVVLKGQTACAGFVRGRVRKIMSRDDVGSLQDGEVLVASMTIPGYLPAMRKASAIVTNEGGIASHIAIIARELRKPCVMATNIATDILEDGDMVEVDAEKGIVRKI